VAADQRGSDTKVPRKEVKAMETIEIRKLDQIETTSASSGNGN
jgi:hypothetical protein